MREIIRIFWIHHFLYTFLDTSAFARRYESGYSQLYDYVEQVETLSCATQSISSNPTIQHIDKELEQLWEELDDDVRDAKRSVISDRYDTNIQEYKTIAFIAIGLLGTAHSINLAKDRAGRTSWKPIRDISQTLGVTQYGFSFSIGRFRKVKPTNLNCGVDDLKFVKWKYNNLKQLRELSEKVENIDPHGAHPLVQLGPYLLPEVVEHQLNMFKFRLISRLSCILQDNNKDANRVVRHINTLTSTSKQKLKLINVSLQQKLSMFENNSVQNSDRCI